MKRLLPLSLLGAVALLPFIANAQMRGGMMGGRGPSVSHAPVRSGPVVAPRVSASMITPRVGPALVTSRPAGARVFTSSGHVFFSSGPFPHFNHSHHRFFFSNCFNSFGTFPCNNGFFFGSNFGFGSPFYSYPYYPLDYTAPAPQPQAVSTDSGGNVELAQEVQRLSDQIEDLRYEEGRRAASERPAMPASPSGSSLSARTPAIATTFVMRDGSHVVAQNYALTGQTLWIFDEHKARKIALSEIDREATEKFNAANGIDIRLP